MRRLPGERGDPLRVSHQGLPAHQILPGLWIPDAYLPATIAAREAAGHRLDNRLVTIERAVIEDARLDGHTASIQVRFDADIAAVTRDADGNVVAGTLSDAIPTHDVWTFRRNLASRDPNWLLVETDDAA